MFGSYLFTYLLWTVRGSNPGGGEISARSDRPWGLPSLLYNGYRVFPGGKVRPGRAADHSPLSSAEVLEEWPLGHNRACNGVTLLYFTYLLTYLFTRSLTPWSRFFPEKLTGSHLVKKFAAYYGTRKSITALEVPATCPCPEPDQSIPCLPIRLPENPSSVVSEPIASIL